MTWLKTSAVIDIKEIPLKLLTLLDDFLGIWMMIVFFHCIGASSDWRTMLNICRRCSVSWSPPCLNASAVTLWSFPGGLPVLMLLTALEISSNVKSLVLMLRLYSAAAISSVLRDESVLRSSLSIQPIHLINQRMKMLVHHFACLLKKTMFWSSLCSTFWLYWNALWYHLYYWLRELLHIFVKFCWFCHWQVIHLLVQWYFSLYCSFHDYGGFGIFCV